MKITQGKWTASEPKISEVAKGQTYFSISCNSAEMRYDLNKKPNYPFVGFYYPDALATIEEAKANVHLFTDAGNTYQATNKLPSELAEANKELWQALKKALTVLVKAEYTDGYDATIEAELVDTLHKHTNHA